MRHVPLLALVLLVPGALALPATPSYWEGDGLAQWVVFGTTATNHGPEPTETLECQGALRVRVLGPAVREVSAGDATVTVGERAEHQKYRVAVDVTPDAGPCAPLSVRLYATHSGLDLFDERFACDGDACSTLTLAWSEDHVGSLAMSLPGANGTTELAATIGVTFRTP